MRRKARILFVNVEGRIAGAETSLLLLAGHLREKYCMSIACPRDSDLAARSTRLGICCHGLPVQVVRNYLSPIWFMYWFTVSCRLVVIALTSKVEIIHANSLTAATVSVLAASIGRKKLIWHERDFSKHGVVLCVCSWSCTQIIAISSAVQDHLIRQGIAPDKVEVVYNGIEVEPIAHVERADKKMRVARASHEKVFVFANIGQFVPWKKQTAFLEAASLVKNTLPGSQFILVGDDIFGRDMNYKSELLRRIRDLNLSDWVHLTGWQENMTTIWKNINCLVHTAEREPFGRVIIEAMAARVPVIAVDSNGPSEIIHNGVSGILVSPGNIDELAEAMLHIAHDPQLAARLTAAAYRHVIADFTAEQTAERVGQIYQNILAA